MVTLFIHLKTCQSVFLKFPKTPFFFFTIPPAVYEDPNVSTSSATLAIVCLFYCSHPSGCEQVSSCGFDLHYPSGCSCRVFFHMLIDHLYLIIGEMTIQIQCPLAFLLNRFFWTGIKFTAKLSGKQENSYPPPTPVHAQLPQLSTSCTRVAVEPTLTRRCHPKSVVQGRVRSWCCTFCGF